jgi:hypothetical protein
MPRTEPASTLHLPGSGAGPECALAAGAIAIKPAAAQPRPSQRGGD